MACDFQNQFAGQFVFLGDHLEDRFKGFPLFGVPQAVHVVMGQVEIHLGEGHFHFGNEHPEERPTLMEAPQQVELFGVAAHFFRERRAEAKPARQKEPTLGPAEDPWNGPQAGEVLGTGFASGWSTGDLQLADFLDRCDLLEKRHQIGIVVNQSPVMVPRAGG